MPMGGTEAELAARAGAEEERLARPFEPLAHRPGPLGAGYYRIRKSAAPGERAAFVAA